MVRVTVPSFAKLNLALRVLHKRPDGFHELRTIFQTISLRDELTIEFDFAKRTQIDVASSVEIPDNLVVRSAKRILDHLKVEAWVRFSLSKQIPMGAGLGGGSSNAAAVLAALPALAGRRIPLRQLVRLAETLGSDVPFFLHGGTAVGIGRGHELYPLPDQPRHHVLVVSGGIHVSTAEAYRALVREPAGLLTWEAESPILGEFQSVAWALADGTPKSIDLDSFPLKNDFQGAVFGQHPRLARILKKLRAAGANPAMMTGSGSAIFGVFASASEAQAAAKSFDSGMAFPAQFVSRTRYRSVWRRALGPRAQFSCFAERHGGVF